MKKLFAIAVCCMFVGNVFADDWRMKKYDLNSDGSVTHEELLEKGCKLRASLFKHADKNLDGGLSKKELRTASTYVLNRCPKTRIRG